MPSTIGQLRTVKSFLVFTILIAGLVARPVRAQSTFGTLTGTITDASGAVLAGTTITATNTATKNVRTVVTDSVGEYVLPNLDAGIYRITMTLSGFAVARA